MNGTLPWAVVFLAVLGLYIYVRSRRTGKASKR